MMEILLIVAEVCGALSAIAALLVLFVKPLRERVMGMKNVIEGQKCLLRGEMLRVYYKHKDDGEIRQYEYENFLTTYAAYRALGGNSFIEHIFDEVKEWSVIR